MLYIILKISGGEANAPSCPPPPPLCAAAAIVVYSGKDTHYFHILSMHNTSWSCLHRLEVHTVILLITLKIIAVLHAAQQLFHYNYISAIVKHF